MKKLCAALLFLLAFTTTNAQIGLGLRVGYSVADFKDRFEDPKAALTLGIPIEYTFSDHFALRTDLSFYKYGSLYEESQLTQFLRYERTTDYNSLRLPVSLLWRPLAVDKKIYLSLNAGIGYAYYVDVVSKYVTYREDGTTGIITRTEDKNNIGLGDQNVFNQHEFFAVFGADLGTHINEKYRVTLNLRFMHGLHDLNIDPTVDKTDENYIGLTPIGLSASIILLRYF